MLNGLYKIVHHMHRRYLNLCQIDHVNYQLAAPWIEVCDSLNSQQMFSRGMDKNTSPEANSDNLVVPMLMHRDIEAHLVPQQEEPIQEQEGGQDLSCQQQHEQNVDDLIIAISKGVGGLFYEAVACLNSREFEAPAIVVAGNQVSICQPCRAQKMNFHYLAKTTDRVLVEGSCCCSLDLPSKIQSAAVLMFCMTHTYMCITNITSISSDVSAFVGKSLRFHS